LLLLVIEKAKTKIWKKRSLTTHLPTFLQLLLNTKIARKVAQYTRHCRRNKSHVSHWMSCGTVEYWYKILEPICDHDWVVDIVYRNLSSKHAVMIKKNSTEISLSNRWRSTKNINPDTTPSNLNECNQFIKFSTLGGHCSYFSEFTNSLLSQHYF